MELRAARRDEREQVLDLLSLWYGEREFFARYNRNDPSFRDELCLVAADGNQLVATVQIFDRRVNFESRTIPLGGIGSVFTREDYRHRRVASGLMRLALETMAREGFELSLLFAERLTFYNQFGWQSMPRKFTLLPDLAGIAAPGDYTMDVFDAARDMGEIDALHRRYSGRLNATAVRDAACWRGNLIYAGSEPLTGCREYFALCRDLSGRIAAYARACRLYKLPMVIEFGYADGPAAMVALFHFLGMLAAAKLPPYPLRGDHAASDVLRSDSSPAGPGVLVTQMAHDPALQEALRDAGTTATHHEDTGPMWRVIAADQLGRRFKMEPAAAAAHLLELIASDGSLFWTADRF